MIEVNKNILKEIYKKRPKESKKYDFGLLIVIGGSDFYTGSPALTAVAAFRAGVDMVNVLAPKRAADIVASFSPNLAAYPLEGKWLDKNDLATILGITESAEAVSEGRAAIAIGNGLGRSEETQATVLDYLEKISIPAVIDADAIHAISKKPQVVSGRNFLLTPHSYEFFILTKKDVSKVSLEERIKTVQEAAAKLNTTILLKGPIDIISDGKNIALNKTGCALMTKGGMGDTLAGIAGAFLARGANAFLAAQAAAYINGTAGEMAGERLGESMLATDLIAEIKHILPRTI